MGLREANQKFSKAIKAVKAGEEVILTERGKAIAMITPLPETNRTEGIIRRLEAAGLLRPAVKRGPMPEHPPLRIKGVSISRILREDRDSS
jgi:prevent-host-death family protein